MLHAAAMLAGLSTVWLVLTQRWSTPLDFALALSASFVCVVIASRFGGLGRTGPFLRVAPGMALALSRSGAVMRGALATMRAALAADVTLNPALVRVKWRVPDAHTRAVFADLVSAAPGAVVVETEMDGALVHVMNEDAVEAAELSRLETRVAGGRGEQ
ncbi:Na(+)/H(+) antiporter subunit E [alpha proteobacterium U9-1i]|nr:Na(+)/H(+) antiporter subunit E [alpha proteobacterium U9-1i]